MYEHDSGTQSAPHAPHLGTLRVCSGNKYDANEEFLVRALARMGRLNDYDSHARA